MYRKVIPEHIADQYVPAILSAPVIRFVPARASEAITGIHADQYECPALQTRQTGTFQGCDLPDRKSSRQLLERVYLYDTIQWKIYCLSAIEETGIHCQQKYGQFFRGYFEKRE